MSLIINNPDRQGVREGFADEEISFWDLPDPLAEFYPLAGNGTQGKQYEDEAAELENLVQDFNRVCCQSDKLLKLMPQKSKSVLSQFYDAANEVDRKVKKLLGNKVSLEVHA